MRITPLARRLAPPAALIAALALPTMSSAINPPSNGGGGGGGSTEITGASCGQGSIVWVSETIRVTSGTFDGGCRVYTATSALGDGGQSENQKPIFRVENGATLKNVVIGHNGADGIHVYNGATLDNITWNDVGEDALTVKSAGDVTIRNIEGYNAYDKFFQINAPTKLHVSNCIIRNAGKALRQNGGTNFRMDVTFDRCDISGMKEGVFRTDSPTSVARITNSRVRNGTTLCIGFTPGNCTSSNITYY